MTQPQAQAQSFPFDLDAFVKNYHHPMQLVVGISAVERVSQGVRLRCATTQFNRRWRDRYGTLVEIGVPGDSGASVAIQVEFITPEVFRFRMNAGSADGIPDNRTPMLADDFAPSSVAVEVQEDDKAISLRTSAITLTLHRKPWRMSVSDAAGRPVFDTIPAAVYQHPPTGESHLDGASITDAWPWFFRDLYPLGFLRDSAGLAQTFLTATIRHDEHFYGFGEKFSTLDKRGQAINLWHANATGNTWPASYKNVPFFLSSNGYGLFTNSAYPIKYHMGDLSHTHYSMHLQDGLLDFFFVYGPTYKEIIPRYTAITGQPGLPPLWSFGLWMSRMSYRAQDQVEHIARQLREHDIPCDVIHIDTDWFKTPWVNDLTFSEERFPDPAGMIRTLRDQGFRLTLWQIPYIGLESAFYREGVERGYFAKREDGTPWYIDGFFGPTAVVDYSNPETVAWMQDKFKALFDMGVAAIKTDFGEGAPPAATYATVDGLAMHNLYPLLYNRAVFEVTKAQTGDGIVWGRSVYAGSQRYPVHWGGDPAALWGDLGNLWHGGLGFGLCGFPFWSVDIGGFGGTPTPEMYVRWAQAGLFVSHPRAHGPIALEPWVFGEEAERIFRQYAKLRYRLVPYLWGTAHRSVETSLPVMRPMLLDWQDDPTTVGMDDQFMFGEWLLVAPILDPSNQRKVYLPAGAWYDYWTGEVLHGPRWMSVSAPLDVLPLYVRSGAILPMAQDMDYIGQKPWSPLTLDIYPAPGASNASSFTLADGDERIRYDLRTDEAGCHLTLGAGEREYWIQIHGREMYGEQPGQGVTLTRLAATVPAESTVPLPQAVDLAALQALDEGWCLTSAQPQSSQPQSSQSQSPRLLVCKVKGRAQPQTISVR
jgi:alpha-D-xyloside xylohydrolase